MLGSNGSGKSHFLRLLALGGTDPDARPATSRPSAQTLDPVPHTGRAKLGARVVPGWFAQAHEHPELLGRTLLDILHPRRRQPRRLAREAASRALDRYGLVEPAEQTFESL